MSENLNLPVISIDALGKPCPMPLLMLKKQLKNSAQSQNILLKASDPHSEIDILRYCQLKQLNCTFTKISENEFHFLIRI